MPRLAALLAALLLLAALPAPAPGGDAPPAGGPGVSGPPNHGPKAHGPEARGPQDHGPQPPVQPRDVQPREVQAVAARPGTLLTLGFTAPAAGGSAPLVLDAELTRPGDALPARWSIPAAPGLPGQAVWEFAYPWEIVPGPWRLRVSFQGRELASAVFDVSADPAAPLAAPLEQTPAPSAAPAPARPGAMKPGQVRDDFPKASATKAPGAPKAPDAATARDRPAPARPDAAKAEPARTEPRQSAPGRADPAGAAQARPDPAKADLGRSDPAGVAPARPDPGRSGPDKAAAKGGASAPRPVGGDPSRQVHAVIVGSYSEQARAQWVASFLRASGRQACVRSETAKGRTLWAVVAGWRESAGEAARDKETLARLTGDALVRPMRAGDLEKGLDCR